MTKTYFLPADFDNPPEGPIRLGNVIAKPLDPLYTLNKNTPVTPLDSQIYSTPKNTFKATRGKMRSGEAGVWAQILESIDFKIQGKYERSAEDTYIIDTIDTSFFVPSIEYLQKSVAPQGVVNHLKASRWRNPDLFVITGIKVAKGAKIVLGKKKSVGGAASGSFDGKSSGLPFKAGGSASAEAVTDESTEFTGDNFVLAYQLRKIICKKGKVVGSEEYKDGAMLGNEDSVKQLSVEIESVAEHEATANDINEEAETFPFLEEDKEDCVVVIPKIRYENKK
jgi:hypothetical protein